ncbi:hypothetical protein BX600DRAFT_158024 [Xylariales sp. PMI_506]|nr:hypothetical protein BX600DRAFT_158024 [Xylariales sp. PMI_506]
MSDFSLASFTMHLDMLPCLGAMLLCQHHLSGTSRHGAMFQNAADGSPTTGSFNAQYAEYMSQKIWVGSEVGKVILKGWTLDHLSLHPRARSVHCPTYLYTKYCG